jgi:hypothetical protein
VQHFDHDAALAAYRHISHYAVLADRWMPAPHALVFLAPLNLLALAHLQPLTGSSEERSGFFG